MSKIMVVNNEPDLELLIEQKFRKQIKEKELIFIFSNSAEEAFRIIQGDEDIEVVITDVNLPAMQGFQLLANLESLSSTLKTVIVSPYGDLNAIRTAMNLGAYDFITRPLNLDEFHDTLYKTLARVKDEKQEKSRHNRLLDIEKELDVAKSIQSSIIPHKFDPFPGNNSFEIFGTMLPAKRIGGDFFDFFPLPKNRLGFCIADVSGKGIPAALFMTMSRGLLRSLGSKSASPIDCLTQLNTILTTENESSMFVTGFYGILEIDTGKVVYCNAGHNPPYLIKKGQKPIQIARGQGIALGVTTDLVTYEEHSFQMGKGDVFILYTDGVTEAMNKGRELYQEKNLEIILDKVIHMELPEMIKTIVKDVETFAGGALQADDITLLAFRYKG